MKRANLPNKVIINTKNGKVILKRYLGIYTDVNIYRKAKELKNQGHYIRIVEVLPHRLKVTNDLHGKPYKPTKWLFAN